MVERRDGELVKKTQMFRYYVLNNISMENVK